MKHQLQTGRRIKYSFRYILLGAALVTMLFSCKKTSSPGPTYTTFIKICSSGRNLSTVNSFILSDGNYLIIGKDPASEDNGLIVKMDINGQIIWQKQLSSSVTRLDKAMPLISGFICCGYDNTPSDGNLNVISYDNNGAITSVNTLNPGSGCGNYNMDMIQLANGGYGFAGSLWDYYNIPVPFLIVTNSAFKVQYQKVFTPLNDEPQYALSSLLAYPNGTLGMAGYYFLNNLFSTYLLTSYPFACEKSFTQLGTNEDFAAGPALITGSGQTAIAFAKANISADSGALVNYNNSAFNAVSGTIGVCTCDSAGNLINTFYYSGYQNNGSINSMKPTSDGGYILCGTVNQLNALAASQTRIYILKLDAGFNRQWSNTYNTIDPSYGVDACQTADGGFLISGFKFAFSKNYSLVVIKTDPSGNLD